MSNDKWSPNFSSGFDYYYSLFSTIRSILFLEEFYKFESQSVLRYPPLSLENLDNEKKGGVGGSPLATNNYKTRRTA